MIFNDILKTATTEVSAFAKRNGPRFAVLSDLKSAMDRCKTREARAMIESMYLPLESELQKECDALNARIGAVWKKAKGEKPPADVEKKLDQLYQKNVKSLQGTGKVKAQVSKGASHSKWAQILSISI